MKLCVLLAINLLLAASVFYGEPAVKLQMKWGLQNEKYFKESQEKAEVKEAMKTSKKEPQMYRFFTPSDEYERVIMRVFARHNRLWNSFRPVATDVAAKKAEFSSLIEREDPLLLGWVRDLAPRLYFDFIGSGNQHHVLESISIKTINFDEYKGGGFAEKEAWYDIELCHKPGTKVYPVDKKLRFDGSGRAVLRFWSDNYYEGMGMSPMGCYTIDVTFNFLVDGEKQSVSTGPFKIDV